MLSCRAQEELASSGVTPNPGDEFISGQNLEPSATEVGFYDENFEAADVSQEDPDDDSGVAQEGDAESDDWDEFANADVHSAVDTSMDDNDDDDEDAEDADSEEDDEVDEDSLEGVVFDHEVDPEDDEFPEEGEGRRLAGLGGITFGRGGQSACPTGSVRVTSLDECKKAASELRKGFGGANTYQTLSAGCFFNGWHVYFQTRALTAPPFGRHHLWTHWRHRPLCRGAITGGHVHYSAQVKWAAESMLKLEAGACRRESKGRQANRFKNTRGVGRRRRWKGSCPNGWRNDGWGTCQQPCSGHGSDWVDAAFNTCRHRCPHGWAWDGSSCHRACSDYGGFETTCGTLYCATDSAACRDKVTKIGLAFGEVLANLAGPSVSAMKSSMKAYKKASKAGKLLAFKKAISVFAKKLVVKTKAKLYRKMKRNIRTKVRDYILDHGAEMVIAAKIANEGNDAELKSMAMDMVELADPSGVVGLVRAFQAPECKHRKISDMPTSGLRRLVSWNVSNDEFPSGRHDAHLSAYNVTAAEDGAELFGIDDSNDVVMV